MVTLSILVVAPYFTAKLENLNVECGADFNVTCSAGGLPDPQVHWRLTDMPYIDFAENLTRSRNTLIITNFQTSTNFTCVATNKLGSTSYMIKVRVTGATKAGY